MLRVNFNKIIGGCFYNEVSEGNEKPVSVYFCKGNAEIIGYVHELDDCDNERKVLHTLFVDAEHLANCFYNNPEMMKHYGNFYFDAAYMTDGLWDCAKVLCDNRVKFSIV